QRIFPETRNLDVFEHHERFVALCTADWASPKFGGDSPLSTFQSDDGVVFGKGKQISFPDETFRRNLRVDHILCRTGDGEIVGVLARGLERNGMVLRCRDGEHWEYVAILLTEGKSPYLVPGDYVLEAQVMHLFGTPLPVGVRREQLRSDPASQPL